MVSLLLFATAWVARRMARRRSLAVLAIFTTAMLVAFVAPRVSFALICGALMLHVRPEVFGSRA